MILVIRLKPSGELLTIVSQWLWSWPRRSALFSWTHRCGEFQSCCVASCFREKVHPWPLCALHCMPLHCCWQGCSCLWVRSGFTLITHPFSSMLYLARHEDSTLHHSSIVLELVVQASWYGILLFEIWLPLCHILAPWFYSDSLIILWKASICRVRAPATTLWL